LTLSPAGLQFLHHRCDCSVGIAGLFSDIFLSNTITIFLLSKYLCPLKCYVSVLFHSSINSVVKSFWAPILSHFFHQYFFTVWYFYSVTSDFPLIFFSINFDIILLSSKVALSFCHFNALSTQLISTF
jgi:FlaA1/EpsC-like NDP-sugar epimerase